MGRGVVQVEAVLRVLHGHVVGDLSEFEGRAIGCDGPPSVLRRTKNWPHPVRSYSLSRRASRPGSSRRGRADIGMQRDRLFIRAHHRFGGIVRSFVRLQHVFHLGDVLIIQSATQHISFPPRLEIVVEEQNPDGFSSHTGTLRFTASWATQPHRPAIGNRRPHLR